MAERDVFSFDIHANNRDAKKALQELKQLAGEVTEASGNLQASPALSKNFTDLVKEMAQAQNKYTEFKNAMEGEIEINTGIVYDSRSADQAKKKAKETIDAIKKDMESARKDFMVMNNQAVSTFKGYERTTGKKAHVVPNYATYQNEPDATEKSRNFINRTQKSVESETREAIRIGNSALSSKYINNSNASTYKRISDNLLSEDVQGAPIEDILSGKQIEPKPGSVRQQITYAREEAKARQATLDDTMENTAPATHKQNLQRINEGFQPHLDRHQETISALEPQKEAGTLDEAKLQQLEEAYAEHERIETNFNKTRKEEITRFRMQMTAFNKEFKATEDVINKSASALDSLDESARNLSAQLTEVKSGNIRQKHDRDEWQGRVSERASAIGLAVAGAVAYAMGSRYASGKQTVTAMREDSLNIGYRTGDYDFRGIRQDYMEQGAPQGWKGQDMIAFSEAILGSLGYIDQDNLTSNMQNVADFSKFSGAGQESSTAYTEGLFSTGAISTADQARAIQEGFIGGIKASGMEGREKEQLDALTAINDNIYRGREATEEEINSRNAMTAVLSGTGNRGLQGDNLADFMMGADNAIQQADPFSNIGMLLGVGTDEQFSGNDWMYELMKIQEQGFSPDNFNTILENLRPMTDGSSEMMASELKRMTGVNTGVESIKDFLDQYPDGVPVGEEGQKLLEELQQTGGQELDTRETAYMESGDQSAQAQEAYLEKMDSLLNDNEMIDALNGVKETFGDWASESALRAVGATIGIGAGAGITTALTGIFGTMIGTAGLKMFSKTMFGTGSPLVTAMTKSFGGAGTVAKTATPTFLGDQISSLKGATQGVPSAGDGGASALGGLKGGAKGLMGGISKVAPWLMVANGMYQTATAEDKTREGFKQATGIGGAMAGGKSGALAGGAIGTMILPGVGTAIGSALGGLIGGVGGYSLGSKVGDRAGEAVSNRVNGRGGGARSDADAVNALETIQEPIVEVKGTSTSYEDNLDTIASQEEKANTTQKVHAERLRDENISRETQNLSKWETLLADMRKLLQMSASQNGIIGALTGLDTNSGSGGAGGKAVGDGQYWTNSDLTKHDLGSTSTELTAQQLNDWINSNTKSDSVMRGMGEAFMTAGQESGLDPRYLVAHSALETGWGTSKIAKDKGNMYGIGAFDASPYASAYGYSDAEAGIIEGAKWIRENYYDKGNTNLTKMHEAGYATDPGWADKIGNTMKGAEKHTQPSQEVNVNTTVNLTGSGNTQRDAERLGNAVTSNISTAFRHERIRT